MTDSNPTNDDLVLCASPDGWSLHAPGSTDEEIATGEAPYLVQGTGRPASADYARARAELARRGADGAPVDPTSDDLDAIRRGAYNDLTRRIERRGIRLSHDEAEAIGDVGCDWLTHRLRLHLVTDDRGTMFLPGRR